jgi:hypothetical protein
MIDFILSNLEYVVYGLIFLGIYAVCMYLWKKIASLETSVYRLDKIVTAICMKKSKEDFVSEMEKDEMNKVFKTEIIVDDKQEIRRKDDVDLVDDIINEVSSVSSNNTYTKSKLSKMNLENLRETASSLNLDTNGTKNELITNILANKN